MDREYIAWDALEYEYREKSADWFWAVGVIALAAAVTAAILGNVLFAVLIVVGAAALAIHAVREPLVVHFAISERGVSVGKTLYPWKTLDSFWVETRDGNPRIIMKSQKVFMPFLVIPLGDTNPADAHEILLAHLDEEEHVEPVSQRIMEILGF